VVLLRLPKIRSSLHHPRKLLAIIPYHLIGDYSSNRARMINQPFFVTENFERYRRLITGRSEVCAGCHPCTGINHHREMDSNGLTASCHTIGSVHHVRPPSPPDLSQDKSGGGIAGSGSDDGNGDPQDDGSGNGLSATSAGDGWEENGGGT
jgi:hypothetical protein